MTKIKRISIEDNSISIEIHQTTDGLYKLQKYVKEYDNEEEVFYEVRMTPDPAGLFGNVESAIQEAKLVLGSIL